MKNNRFHLFKKGNKALYRQEWIAAPSREAAELMSNGGEYTGSRINPADLPDGTKASRWLILGTIKTKMKP